jgi:transmembrane sensor
MSARDLPAKASERDRLFDDPALAEALALCAANGRLSDQEVREKRARRRSLAGAGVAALLVAGIGGAAWWKLGPQPEQPSVASYETRRGQQLAIELEDGSRLRLNGATRVAVTLAADRRDVRLESGEAYFDVAHDSARPFTVHAGESDARVLGTAFDVDLRREQVELAVYRGAVRFGPEQPGGASVVVKAGWRSHFQGGGARSPHRFDVAQQDWRQGWLDTQDMKLGDLIEALNRQGGPLVLPPPAHLADMPIGGRFRLDDPEQLLGAIGVAYGFQVKREGQKLRITA